MKDGKGVKKATETMRIVEVIPVSKNPRISNLSYFTKEDIRIGEFVRIAVRASSSVGIVSAVQNARQAKTALKSASYSLKKISSRDKMGGNVSPEFLRAVEKTALFYAAQAGNVMDIILPKMFSDNPSLISAEYEEKEKELPLEPLVVQVETEERLSRYKSLIREAFAKKQSVLFISPTDIEAERVFHTLSSGINEYAYLFTLNKKPKEMKKMLQEAKEVEHPILLVTTPAGIAFQRPDLKMIILDRENSRAYRSMARPFINFKTFVEILSRETRKQLVLGDSVLSIESMWREKEGLYREFSTVKWRLALNARTTLVDMKAAITDEKFEIISEELKDLIRNALSEGRKVFLFGARKGLAPVTVCGHCGTVLPCKNCRAPVVLHEKNGDRVYICHACTACRHATTVCDRCKSWKLIPLGIGIDLIAKEVKSLFPSADVSILDKDHAHTKSQAKKIVTHFADKGDILVGTELAFLYLEKVPFTAIVSTDSLFSIPDFSINERIFYLVSHLREMARVQTLVQTRNIGKQILAWACQGNILDFYRTEIAERESLMYPPFAIFVKVSSPRILEVKNNFLEWHPDFVKDSMIIRLEKEKWPDQKLVEKLSLLSPDFLIKVDPESIL